MVQPELVESRLDDEEVVATVNLSGEDKLVVTPTRCLLYRAEGLISDESVEDFRHEASRLTLSEGRRKVKIRYEYPIEDTKTMSLPAGVLDSVLHYLLAGVMNAAGVTEPDEAVRRVFRFNEMTVVITSHRVVLHVGSALWDQEYEQYPFDEFTGLEFEDGSVATQIVLYTRAAAQRVKAPNDRAAEVKHELTGALFEYFEVDDVGALEEQFQDRAPERDEGATETIGFDLDDAVEPIETGQEEETVPAEITWPGGPEEATHDSTKSQSEAPHAAVDSEELSAYVRDLEDNLARQQELLEQQARVVKTLAETIEAREEE